MPSVVDLPSVRRLAERAARARERLIELGERLLQVVADRLERQLVELLDDADDARLDRLELARDRSAAATGFCDQSIVTGGASGKKSNATNSAPVSRLPDLQLRASPRATSVSISSGDAWRRVLAAAMSTILTPSRAGSTRTVTGTENSKVFGVELRADVGDLADRDALELDRRAAAQPAHRLLEDEHVGLRIARRQLEGLGRGR